MTATVITPASVPRQLGADADAVVVSGTTVLFAHGEIHELNASAHLIWQACTGTVTVAAIARDLATRFDIAPAVMEAEVVGAIEELTKRDLLTTEPDVPMLSKDVLEPVALCASCGEGPAYDCQLVVDVGDAVLTIGMDDGMVEPMTAALGDCVVGVLTDAAGRPSYGVVLPDATAAAHHIREVTRLYRGPDVLLRARRSTRVLDALVTQVSHHRLRGGLLLDALAVGDGEQVVLVPEPRNRVAFERAAARAGLAVGDLASVVVEDETIAHLGPVDLEIDRSRLVDLAASRGDAGFEPPPLGWGRVQIAALAVQGPATSSSVLAEMAPLLAGEPAPLGPLLACAHAVPIVRGVGIPVLVEALRS